MLNLIQRITSKRIFILREARTTLSVGIPVIIAQLLQMSMNVTDTIMAGQLSPEDLAAVAIGWSTAIPFIVLSMGIMTAINPIVAQLSGAGTTETVGKHLRQALWLSLFLGLISFLILRNMEPVLSLLGIQPDLIPLTMKYVKALSYGLFPIYSYMCLRFFNEGLSVTRPGMYVGFLGMLVNIGGNYVLMYGKLGMPALGAEGCGYATAIVGLAMFIAILIFVYRYPTYKAFGLFDNMRLPEWHYFRELLSVGIPIGISSAMEVSMFAIVSLLMGTLSTQAVAGHQIAINVASVAFMIPFGLSTAITARVGQAKGLGSWYQVRFRGATGIGLSVLIMIGTASLLALFPQFITQLYTNDVQVQQIAIQLLLMAAIFQISDGLQVSGFGALRGLKDTRIPMIVNLIAYWLVGLPLGYWLGIINDNGPIGLWIGLIAGLTVAAVLHNIRFYLLTKRELTAME